MWETFCHALGIVVPETQKDDNGVFYNINELRNNSGVMWCRGGRPVVVFPEGTKTNTQGVLAIDKAISKMIVEAAVDHKMVTHALHFDHKYKNFAPYNTTDKSGYSHAMTALTQFFC